MKVVILLVLSFAYFICEGQVDRTFAGKIEKIYHTFNPEFVVVHTDKPAYLSGEIIWYKVYLNNVPYSPAELSVIAYVELISATNELITRHKLKCIQGSTTGSISLPENFPGGNYILKAYTLKSKGLRIDEEYNHRNLVVLNGSTQVVQKSLNPMALAVTDEDFEWITFEQHNDRITARLRAEADATLVVHHKGKLVLTKECKAVESVLEINDPPYGFLEFALFNPGGLILRRKAFYNQRKSESQIQIGLDKELLARRERGEIVLTLKDGLGKPLGGNFSMAIFPKAYAFSKSDDKMFDGTIDTRLLAKLDQMNIPVPGEMTIYPKSSQTISPVDFAINEKLANQVILPNHYDSIEFSLLLERAALVTSLNESYPKREQNHLKNSNVLRLDDEYRIEEYVGMASIEEFIREVVTNARISSKGKKTQVRLLNTENQRKVFKYKKDPLLLVDGFVWQDLDEVLAIDIATVDKVGIVWKESTLSMTSIVSLADNGIISIHTKKNDAATNPRKRLNIYGDLHQPIRFKEQVYVTTGDTEMTPDFRELLYWNPSISIHGRSKVSFFSSDEITEYVIEVKGITERGDFLSAQMGFRVR